MKSFASESHRTGQPRCVQLRAKAMKLPPGLRRSQAPVRAETPAQTSGEASSNATSTVRPGSNRSAGPTARQTSGTLRKSGATRNPRMGTPTSAAPRPPQAVARAARNRRRPGVPASLFVGLLGPLEASLMHQLPDPPTEGDEEGDR